MSKRTGDEKLGARLYRLRRRKNREARRVGLTVGCTAGHLNHVESGRVMPSLRLLVRLAAFYGVSLHYLAGHLVEAERETDEE